MLNRSAHPQAHAHVSVDRALAATTLALGALAVVLGLAEAWGASALSGLLALAVGGWSQMVSVTVRERFESVFGATAGAVAMAVAFSHGAFFN